MDSDAEEEHTVARIESLKHEQRQVMLDVSSKQSALQRVSLELNLLLAETEERCLQTSPLPLHSCSRYPV